MPVMKAYCNICNLWLNSDDQLVAHQAGRSHKRRQLVGDDIMGSSEMKEQARSFAHIIANQETISKVMSQNNYQGSDDRHTEQRDSSTGLNDTNNSKTIKENEYMCNICVVQLTSRTQADMHYMGSKHKKAMAVMAGKIEKMQDGVKRVLESVCEICNVPLSSKAVADAHYAGSKHERKLKLSQSMRGSMGTVCGHETFMTAAGLQPGPVIANSVPQVVQNSSISLVPVHPGSLGQQRKGLIGAILYCSFCGVSVNSQQQMEAHWQGMKHKNTVNGTLPQTNSTFLARPTTNHNRHANLGHMYARGGYGSSNLNTSHRPGPSTLYVSHQF